ncbi:hypothetical protein EHO59_08920 [Leptospira semungkisensis]|uniref:DUF1554 domain-containing protein n=2 Tax=Leptospira semungkisensis TaxID=2484985 RepID=A0A4R9G1E6_9LEPT|nr:hypothetical protein EHO59_08920 [Leptospira semungkisensis]
MGTVNSILTNAISAGSAQAGITQFTVTGLYANAWYYFAVVVTDEAGNAWVYVNNFGGGNASKTQPGAAYMFDSLSSVSGDLGSRSNVNTICSNRKASLSGINYTWKASCNAYAFVSMPDGTWISGYLVPSIPSTYMILGSQGTMIASNPTQLLSGTIQNTIRSAIPEYTSGSGYWTFATATGGYASADSCSSATSNSSSVSGRIGLPDSLNSYWMDFSINGEGAASGATCDTGRTILCICF